MEQHKKDIKPRRRFFKSMLAGSGIMGAISEIERTSSSSSTGWYTTTWLATILCLLLAGNEYIGLARENAPRYSKTEFEKLLDKCLESLGESGNFNKGDMQIVIDYYMQLTREDKKILLNDLEFFIHHTQTENKRYLDGAESLRMGFEKKIEQADKAVEKETLQASLDQILNEQSQAKELNDIKYKLYNKLLKKFQNIYKFSFI